MCVYVLHSVLGFTLNLRQLVDVNGHFFTLFQMNLSIGMDIKFRYWNLKFNLHSFVLINLTHLLEFKVNIFCVE